MKVISVYNLQIDIYERLYAKKNRNNQYLIIKKGVQNLCQIT